MTKQFLIIFITVISSQIFSQNSKLYIPLNIQKAYNANTRSHNGEPGSAYWQNKSDYEISAEILPDSSYLLGDATITYYNNSPDTLDIIVIRLYQDITKKGASRDLFIQPKVFTDETKINYITVNKNSFDVSPLSQEVIRSSTNLFVKLSESILPNSKVEIKIGWEFEIQKSFPIRMGNYKNGKFYLAYWYPEIAVYDDIDGWDKIEYKGNVEFYNDFSNFEVSLKAPKGNVIWATGELQNAKEVLRKDIYEKYEKAKQSDETIRIIIQQDYEKGLVTADKEFNTWKFSVKNITAFAFAISKNSNWDGASVVVDKTTGRRTLTDAVYHEGAAHYDSTAQYARESIKYLSYELPGYPYPYSHATTFSNGKVSGGMESPMMVNNGTPIKKSSHVGLVFHELSHNYFPFMMGTNERKYAWMDEGWAAFLPSEIVSRNVPSYDYWERRVYYYSIAAGKESEIPPIVPSYSNKSKYSRTAFYNRPANAYSELEQLLGRKLFKKALLEYMDRWNGKHPIPHDFFLTFNDVIGEDLSWFWKPWFYEFGYPDLSISNATQTEKNILIEIKKLGNIPTRIFVTLEFEDGTKRIIEKSARNWKNGNDIFKLKLEDSKIIKSVKVGNKYIPDAVKENNVFKF
ncbi:MAG: M1 family metallopeptidase [Melioribacteraceae bacterium]